MRLSLAGVLARRGAYPAWRCDLTVPSAGRRLDGHSIVGLVLRNEGFDGLAHRGQLLLIEMSGNVEGLLAGILVAAPGREREPLVRTR